MAQFFFYSALTLVPVSLPLAVLLASLITFGNFGERYELLAMKAAGISLLKIMRPLAFFVCGLVGVSFYFQNVVGPIAQAKLGTLILSMKQKSPELDIPEGVFYSEIKDYNLKVAKKNRKTGMLYDVLIYNMKDGFENAHIIYADSGRLEMTADKQHLWLHLYSGDLFGEPEAEYTGDKNGNKSHWEQLNEKGKYSWIKTPLWRGKMAEVGPLARYIIIYTKVKQNLLQPNWAEKMMVDQVDAISKLLNVAPEVWLPSTLGRTITRGLDAQLNACMNKYFFGKLIKNIANGDTDTANTTKWDPSTWPTEEVKGVGLYEAPRGALSHWVAIKDKKCSNYQAVVPTTWNACPRDEVAGQGAFERAMMDTAVKIPEKPLEIVKAIRSFDPCIACATHLYDAKGRTISTVNTDPYIRGGLNG